MAKTLIWSALGLIVVALFVFNASRLQPVVDAFLQGIRNITQNQN